MRRALTAAVLLLSACAGPKPCTRTLCVSRLDGTMETRAWSGAARVTPTDPKPPVPSDSDVTMVFGSADFTNGRAKVTAEEGAAFRFSYSTTTVPSIAVTAGNVFVVLSSGAPSRPIPAGTTFELPTQK